MTRKATVTAFFPGTLAAVFLAGCAGSGTHVAGAPGDFHDRAYLRARLAKDGCPRAQEAICCAKLKAEVADALRSGDRRQGADAIELLALSCPQDRAAALASLEDLAAPASSEAMAAAGSSETSGYGTVMYSVRLPPSDRVYWAGAWFDGKYPPLTRLPPGRHSLDVELHVVPVSGEGKDQLFRVQATGQVEIKANKAHAVVVVVSRIPGPAGGGADPFGVEFVSAGLSDTAAPAVRSLPAADGASSARTLLKPEAAQGLRQELGQPRLPSELRRAQRDWGVVGLCVDATGAIETIHPLRSLHPRHTATFLELGRGARHRPHQVEGRPIPFCYAMVVNLVP